MRSSGQLPQQHPVPGARRLRARQRRSRQEAAGPRGTDGTVLGEYCRQALVDPDDASRHEFGRTDSKKSAVERRVPEPAVSLTSRRTFRKVRPRGSAQRTDETGDNGPVVGQLVAHGGVASLPVLGVPSIRGPVIATRPAYVVRFVVRTGFSVDRLRRLAPGAGSGSASTTAGAGSARCSILRAIASSGRWNSGAGTSGLGVVGLDLRMVMRIRLRPSSPARPRRRHRRTSAAAVPAPWPARSGSPPRSAPHRSVRRSSVMYSHISTAIGAASGP